MKEIFAELLVVGAGAGGLGLSSVASRLGVQVTLLESGKMGGDCLNYGCVPSKALINCGRVSQTIKDAKKYGIKVDSASVDFEKVMSFVGGVVDTIAVHDSVERFTSLGVNVIQHVGKFIGHNKVQAGDYIITAKKIVIATGSSPVVPNIEGISDVRFYTNETIFSIQEQPKHLIVVGGGPIGCELAQAFNSLGSKVTMLVRSHILPKEEKELSDTLINKMQEEGIEIIEKCSIEKLSSNNNDITVHTNKGAINGTTLLFAVGRQANIKGLDLGKAGIDSDGKSVLVNERLQTSNKKVYAIGDVISHHSFTHVAEYHVGILISNLFFKLRKKVNYDALPWVTYCSPELAHVGLYHKDALAKDPKTRQLQWGFDANDRATTSGNTIGKVLVSVNSKSVVVGVSILGPNAGELIQSWTNIIARKRKISELSSIIVPYPTYSEINKRISGSYYTEKFFSKKVKTIARFIFNYL